MKNEFDYLNDVNIDFSVYENVSLSEKEKNKMKRLIKNKKINKKAVFAVAAVISVVSVLGVTGIASDIMYKIVNSVSTGRNLFVQIDMTEAQIKLPKELEEMTPDENGVYTYVDENGNDVAVSLHDKDEEAKDPLKYWAEKGWNILLDKTIINEKLNFDAKLPTYLPDGFEFMGAATAPDSKFYLSAYYKNEETGKYFVIHERLLNDETAFDAGTDGTVDEITINAHTAALTNDSNVNFEIGDVSVSVSGMGILTKDEVIMVAESIK